MAFTGHNLLGWIIMLVCDKHMGKDTTCIKDLHHNHPDVPLFQGIKHLLKFPLLSVLKAAGPLSTNNSVYEIYNVNTSYCFETAVILLYVICYMEIILWI